MTRPLQTRALARQPAPIQPGSGKHPRRRVRRAAKALEIVRRAESSPLEPSWCQARLGREGSNGRRRAKRLCTVFLSRTVLVVRLVRERGMPQKSKKPIKPAKLRASSRPAKSKPIPPKARLELVKRSGSLRTPAKTSSGARLEKPKARSAAAPRVEARVLKEALHQAPTKGARYAPLKAAHHAPSKAAHKTPSKAAHKTPSKATHKTPSKAAHKTPSKAAHKTPSKDPTKASHKAVAKTSKQSPKQPPRTMHALILPPRPKRLAARLLVARAPRAVSLERIPDTKRPVPLSAAAQTRATVKLAELSVSVPAAASPTCERTPRSALTMDAWRSLEALSSRLGRSPLNDEQRVAMRAIMEGHDSVVVLPDDERAVSCYQLPALQLSQPTVVVSPVPAELKAQYEVLSAHRLPVVHVLGDLPASARASALARISRGGALLVLLCPESLNAPDVQKALAKSGIAALVVEEAHCVSDASHEWRPSYAELGATWRRLGSPPLMAITRVATAAVRRDIRERLGLDAPVTIQSPVVRENLQSVTRLWRGEGRQAALVRLVERLTLPGLVLCATPHDVDSVYSALRGAGIAAHRHHSGMTASERAAESSNFASNSECSVMVAVSAFAPGSGLPGIGEQTEANAGFGRGPHRRDLRFLVHYQSPASIEQYLREIQHIGADGLPATCVLLHESSHRSLHEVMLAQQRFRATHLAELGRALETPALEGRTVSIEALALGTGQSRRTMDRLTALLADAGVVSRSAGWVRVLCTATELDEACRRLGSQLYALREQDARRLAAVSALAEASECKLSCLNQYLGEAKSLACGRCSDCVSELLAPSQESVVPHSSMRRGAVQDFSVQAVNGPASGVVPSGTLPGHLSLTARLADFGTKNGPRD